MNIFFKNLQKIENDIEAYFNLIEKSGLALEQGIKEYLTHRKKTFKQRIKDIDGFEGEADCMRRRVRDYLFSRMLIPESRGDVLELLESSDNLIDSAKKILNQFDIEQPDIPKELKKDFLELAAGSVSALREIVRANISYFHEIQLINSHIQNTYYFEKHVDRIEFALKKKIFSVKNRHVGDKMQLQRFAEMIAGISDQAESVGEKLSVSAIKREF